MEIFKPGGRKELTKSWKNEKRENKAALLKHYRADGWTDRRTDGQTDGRTNPKVSSVDFFRPN